MSETLECFVVTPEMAAAGAKAIMARWLELQTPESNDLFSEVATEVFREMAVIAMPLQLWSP